MSGTRREPQPLAKALSELIAMRGFARVRGKTQLSDIWREVAGEHIAEFTKPIEVKRGVLHIAVSNSAMLGELVSFHQMNLLAELTSKHADLKIKSLKFKLRTSNS